MIFEPTFVMRSGYHETMSCVEWVFESPPFNVSAKISLEYHDDSVMQPHRRLRETTAAAWLSKTNQQS